MSKEWNMKLRHSAHGNGHQVTIPAELAQRQDITAGDKMLVWCDGTGVNAKKADRDIPEYPRDHPVDQRVFAKRVQNGGGTTLVLTLPAKIVKFMELEMQKNVTVQDMQKYVRIEPACDLADPASVAGMPAAASKPAPGNAQKRAAVGGDAAPFVARPHPIYRVAKTLRLGDLLGAHGSSAKDESGPPPEGGSSPPPPESRAASSPECSN